MIQASSVNPKIVAQVHEAARRNERVMVILDSNHTHEHVLAEAYAPLSSRGSYCIVFDTVVEDLPDSMWIVPGERATTQKPQSGNISVFWQQKVALLSTTAR